jgi:predicted RNA-binding protein
MKYTYSLIQLQPLRICFLLTSVVLQSCDTPPNSPPSAKKEEAVIPTSIGALTDEQLLSKDSPLNTVPQLQAAETEEIEALAWYKRASSSLNKDNYSRGEALYHLGWLYNSGRGVMCNKATALSFFEQAFTLGKDTPINQTSDQAASIYDQQLEGRVRNQTQEQLIQILTEISHNGDVIIKELENENAHLELDDKADLALLVHHPLFKTNCKSVHLLKQIGSVELIVDFVKHLKGTHVSMINLKETEMGDAEVAEFSKYLQGTQVHTLKLKENEITSAGAIALAKHLQGTQVHTLDLGWNKISDQGLVKFAENLQGTSVHTVSLAKNGIGGEVAINFANHLQGTHVHTVDLSENQIDAEDVIELAKALQGTRVRKLDLSRNKICEPTQQLLEEQYTDIEWTF